LPYAHRGQDFPILPIDYFWQEVGPMDFMGTSLLIHGDGSHKVQVDKGQVHEVILCQGFRLQMGVDATEAL
jgi:hypothetical protein